VTAPASTRQEEPVWFPGSIGDLFGIVTDPTVGSNGVGLVICSSGHWVTTVGPNRFHVRLARHFASLGYTSIRFDYGGIGESGGPSRPYRLGRPFADDAVAAAEVLRERGVDRVVLLGSCYGARTALVAAAAVPGAVGLALYPPPVRDFEHGERVASLPTRELARRAARPSTIAGLFDAATRRRYGRIARRRLHRLRRRVGGERSGPFEWVSRSFVEPLDDALARGIRVLIVYGEDDDFYADFERGTAGPLGEVIARAGDSLTLAVVPGRTHGLGSVDVQAAVLDAVTRWSATLPRPDDVPEP
jgi:pimeloyl-ACP methyl ester carboxylesterase